MFTKLVLLVQSLWRVKPKNKALTQLAGSHPLPSLVK